MIAGSLFMLIRIATHDIYHAGQIRYLWALQGMGSRSSR